jgi:hypothetical protein
MMRVATPLGPLQHSEGRAGDRGIPRSRSQTVRLDQGAVEGRVRVNATRALYEALARRGIPKTHTRDAACVGEVEARFLQQMARLEIKAAGRGDYCRTNRSKNGFPCGRTAAPKGKRAGIRIGRLGVRASVLSSPYQTNGMRRKRVCWR